MEMNLSFFDKYGKLVPNVNYGISVSQSGETILENSNVHSEKGLSTLITRPLNSEEPMSIKVKVNSIGLEEIQENTDNLNEDAVEFTVVPEFGAISIVLFGISISMIILMRAKINPSFLVK
jgi:predicted secreted protein with PEFG-CTERM motif